MAPGLGSTAGWGDRSRRKMKKRTRRNMTTKETQVFSSPPRHRPMRGCPRRCRSTSWSLYVCFLLFVFVVLLFLPTDLNVSAAVSAAGGQQRRSESILVQAQPNHDGQTQHPATQQPILRHHAADRGRGVPGAQSCAGGVQRILPRALPGEGGGVHA